MTLTTTTRGLPVLRPKGKRERTLGPCEEIMARHLRSTHPAIMRDPQTGDLLCAGHAPRLSEAVN